MTPSMLATAAALAVGLPIFALGERIRDRRERRLSSQYPPVVREDFS